jgi:hypothetical protein
MNTCRNKIILSNSRITVLKIKKGKKKKKNYYF